MVLKKRIKWSKGRPLMICPECGANSGPDFINFSRAGEPANVVMKCVGDKPHTWAFAVDQAKAPDGSFYKFAALGGNVT